MEGASTVGRAVITAPDLAFLRGPAFVNIQLSVESATANAADGCIPRRWLPPGAGYGLRAIQSISAGQRRAQSGGSVPV